MGGAHPQRTIFKIEIMQKVSEFINDNLKIMEKINNWEINSSYRMKTIIPLILHTDFISKNISICFLNWVRENHYYAINMTQINGKWTFIWKSESDDLIERTSEELFELFEK